jgi:hypothetical protein
MFTIRREIQDAFRRDARADFRERMIARLRQKLPAPCARHTPEGLTELGDRGIERAFRYGIDIEFNVYVFVGALLVFGEDFDTGEQARWSRDILHDERGGQDLKTKLLRVRIALYTGEAL